MHVKYFERKQNARQKNKTLCARDQLQFNLLKHYNVAHFSISWIKISSSNDVKCTMEFDAKLSELQNLFTDFRYVQNQLKHK